MEYPFNLNLGILFWGGWCSWRSTTPVWLPCMYFKSQVGLQQGHLPLKSRRGVNGDTVEDIHPEEIHGNQTLGRFEDLELSI